MGASHTLPITGFILDFVNGCMEPAGDLPPEFFKAADVIALVSDLQRSVGSLVRDGRAFYSACECSVETDLDERERFGARLANYSEPEIDRWIEADEEAQKQWRREATERVRINQRGRDAIDLLRRLAEYIDDRVDVVDGPDGQQDPNEWASMKVEFEDEIYRLTKAEGNA